MHEAADVGCRYELRRISLEGAELVGLELPRDLRLQERISAGRSTAEMTVGDACERVPCPRQQRLDYAAELQPVLQRTGRMECDSPTAAARWPRLDGVARLRQLRRDHLAEVAEELRYARRLARISRIVTEQLAVLANHRAAAACRHDYRLDALLDPRPPDIDVVPHSRARRIRRGQMVRKRAAAAVVHRDQRYTQAIQHPGGRGVDVRSRGGLHTSRKYQHASVVARRGPGARMLLCRHTASQRRRHQGSQHPAERQERGESLLSWNDCQERAPHQPVSHRPRDDALDVMPPDIQQPPIANPGWTGGLARAASQTPV